MLNKILLLLLLCPNVYAYHADPLAVIYGGSGANLSATGGTHNFIKQSSTGAAFTVGQPAFTDLSGSAACSQEPALTGDVTSSAGSCGTSIAATSNGTLTTLSTLATVSTSTAVTFSGTTASTSTTTGQIIDSGGLGVAGAEWVGGLENVAGVLTAANTTDASNSTTAGTVVSGGLAVAKSANIGTTLITGGNITGGANAHFTKGSNFVMDFNGNASASNIALGNQLNVSGFEITPSTANGGTTYSNPALTITGLGSSASSTTTTINSQAVNMPNLTTGTAADTVCKTSGGQLIIQAAACTISSQRYKENIFSLDEKSGIDEIMELRPVEFNFNRDKFKSSDPVNAYHTQAGLIAEEVAKVDPRLAVYEADGKTVKSYRQEAVISVLIKAVQEQQKEIEEQRSELIELKKRCN